jgi:hypothetical protein
MVKFNDKTKQNEASVNTESKDVGQIIENATHDSVNRKILTSKKAGVTSRYLNDNPAIDYIQTDEQPHFILTARDNTPDIEGDEFEEIKKRGSGSVLHIVTDQRWVCIAANMNGDNSLVIPLDNIIDVEYSTGQMKHTVYLTTNNSNLSIPIANRHDSEDIKNLHEYLKHNIGRGVSDEIDQKAESLANASTDSTVTANKLTASGENLPNTPIIDHIDDGENVKYILTDSSSKRGIGINDKYSPVSPSDGNTTYYVFTDTRILSVLPRENEDKLLEFTYDEIEIKELKTSSRKERNRLVIDTDSSEVHLWMSQHTSKQKEAIGFMYSRTLDNCEYIIIDPITDDSAKLKILDRDTGVAKMETKGWNYGLGFVERSKSSSKIEKEGYEETIEQLAITSDGISMTTQDSQGGFYSGNKQIYRSFNEIGAIDRFKNGFTFYSTSGIYRIELNPRNDNKIKIDEVVEFIRNNINNISDSNQAQATNDEDKIEKLERIAELNEEGILTHKEFERKKSELLEDI